MTFDEATENINVLSAFSTVYGISPTVVRDIISKLKEEYAPTVEMNELEKNTLLKYVYRDSGNFFDLVEYETDYLYRNLSTSELMQAWLHPETIKLVDDDV